ncbi:MAG: outer membrane protein [Aestuariivirga sp.]
MKKFLLAAASVLAMSGTAYAADPVEACADNWSGLYGGLHGGYGFGDVDTGAGDTDIEGFIGGGLAGWNFQTCNFVIGMEGDIGFGEIDGRDGAVDDFDVEPNGHLRIRAGLPMDNIMPFIAGGLAIADADLRTAAASDSELHLGFSIGAGVDWMVTEHFVIRGEYLFDMYGKESYNAPGGSVDFDTHTLRAAAIFHW